MKFRIYLMILSAGFLASCEKFLQVEPPLNQVTADRVFTSDATAIATISGIYTEMMTSSTPFLASGTTFYAGLSADELRHYSPSDRDPFFENNISEAQHVSLENLFWNPAYRYIYSANLTIEKLAASRGVTSDAKRRLTGEAKFVRALCYFYLLNLFGDVPLAITSDYRINEKLPRSPISDVYTQIKSDLSDAANLLPLDYVSGERTRPTRWAALALLARVHLYIGDWQQSEAMASLVIGSGHFSLEKDVSIVFLKNSTEAIWQLLPVNPAVNTWEGNVILPATTSTLPTYILTTSLANALETDDMRRIWIKQRDFQSQTIYYPAKYLVRGINVPVTEYYTVLRLAEQYLLRAEALAMQGKIIEALSDVNIVRERAGLPDVIAQTEAEMLALIMAERRIEMLAEWGHRWFDLKRTGMADQVLGSVKPGWQTTDALWPIPGGQLRGNPGWRQNPGY